MIDLNCNMFRESSKSHAPKQLWKLIMAFLAVFLVIYVAESIIPALVSAKPMEEALRDQGFLDSDKELTFKQSMTIATEVAMKPNVMIPTLLSTGFGTVISLFYCRFFEMRKVTSMGCRKRRAALHYVSGLFMGAAMMSAIVLLTLLFGANKLSYVKDSSKLLILMYFVGFLVQGMSEEFIFRGYLMTSVGGSHSPYLAIGISSVAFGLAHAANPGISPLAMTNLILYGVFAAVYMIHFDNIWGVCGIHSVWNFTQGNLYGISVSGSGQSESIFRTSQNSSHAFLTGGEFGIEGSIATTIVLLTGTAIVLLMHKKRLEAESAAE